MRDTKYKINSQSLLANIANVGFSAVLKGNISSVFSRLRVVTFDAVVFGLCCRPNASLSGYCPLHFISWSPRMTDKSSFHRGTNAGVLGPMHRLLNSGYTTHLEARDKENTTYIEVGKIELILIDPLIK